MSAPTITVKPTDDLAAAINAAVTGSQFMLLPGAAYQLRGNVTIKPGVSVVLSGPGVVDLGKRTIASAPTLACSVPQGASTNFSVYGHLDFSGIDVVSDAVLFRALKGGALNAVNYRTSDTTFQNAIFLPGCMASAISNALLGASTTVNIYASGSNVLVQNAVIGGSRAETTLRTDQDAGEPMPEDVQFVNCEVETGADDKGCVEIRMGYGIVLKGMTYTGSNAYVRCGQGSGGTPGQFVRVAITGNQFTTMRTETNGQGIVSSGPQLTIENGVDADVEGNTFFTDLMQVPSTPQHAAYSVRQLSVTVSQVSSRAKFAGNIRKLARPGIAYDARLWAPQPNPLVTETGTVIQ